MAHYVFDRSTPLGIILRGGLDDLRSALHKLDWVLGAAGQMSAQELVDAFGFADTTKAAAASSELASDVGKLFSDASQSNVHAALVQMLNQFS